MRNWFHAYMLRVTLLLAAAMILAAVAGVYLASASRYGETSREFDKRTRNLVNTVVQNKDTLSSAFVESLGAACGSAVIVSTGSGFLESSPGLTNLARKDFEKATREHSTAKIVIPTGVSDDKRVFECYPVLGNDKVFAVFVEEPASISNAVFFDPGIITILIAAVFVLSLLLALYFYLQDIKPQRKLAHASVRAALGDEINMPFQDRTDPIGDLARSLASTLSRMKEMQHEILASEKIAVFQQLTAGIAHEVRNPLTAMRLTAQMLKRKYPDDKQSQEWIDVIISEIDRLTHHMEQLINFGMPYEPKMRQTVITDVMNEVLLLMRRQIEHAGIIVIVSFEQNLPMVFVDPEQLRQVILNILINSVQAMATAGTLTISARLARVKGDPVITVAIEDTGPGIPEDIAARIFDPFFSTKSAGTGLGLAIAKKIIDAHSGRIRFTSTDKGTIFRIFFPISPKGKRLTEVPTDQFLKLEADEHDKNPRRR